MFYYMHNNINENVLEQGPDFMVLDKTQFSCHCVHAIHACKDVFNPNITTFQSNCAEGLPFRVLFIITLCSQ